MKRSTTHARFLRCNLALILFCILLTAPVGATGSIPGEPDPAYPQLIDPTLQWHTFMGGSNNEWGNSIAKLWSAGASRPPPPIQNCA